jgi:hypothetical protein
VNSSSTQSPPKTLSDWIDYLHNAVATPKDSPDYEASREAAHFAVQRIHNLGVAANATDPENKAIQPAAVQAIGVGLLHSFGLGSGEPIAGLVSAIRGKGFREGAQQYREGLENVQGAHPNAEIVGEGAGLVGSSLLPVERAVEGGRALAQAIRVGRANALQRFATGVLHTDVLPGAALGGIAGFSGGGEDPGDVGARVKAAGAGAAVGAGASALLGGLGALRVPRWVTGVGPRVKAALGKGASPAEVANVAESAIRARLTKEGFSPENIEQLVATWKRGGNPAPIPRVETPVTTRPGETITQIAPRGYEVTGMRATPPAPTTPTVTEILTGERQTGMPDIGRGKTMPYYPRGGKVEQAFAPSPVASRAPSAVPGQAQLFADWLRAASDAAEAHDRIGTLQALGVVSPTDVPALLQLLGIQ